MKKDLMKTNCYDVEDTLIIAGSCLDRMQPEAYKELLNNSCISSNSFK